MRQRLTRLDEIYPGYSIFFITFCTHKYQNLLANALINDSFNRFSISAEERNTLVGRYVIMPDHIHLFVHFGDAQLISTWMKSLKNSLSKTLRSSGIPAPHWQKGYFDHLVRSEQSYEEKWIYVEQNPVRKGLVSESCIWPYQGEVAQLPFD